MVRLAYLLLDVSLDWEFRLSSSGADGMGWDIFFQILNKMTFLRTTRECKVLPKSILNVNELKNDSDLNDWYMKQDRRQKTKCLDLYFHEIETNWIKYTSLPFTGPELNRHNTENGRSTPPVFWLRYRRIFTKISKQTYVTY